MQNSNRVLQFCLVFSGVVFLLKGVKASISTASDLASVHISSAYALGHITGEVVAALGLLAAGVAFILLAHSKRGAVPNREPSA